MIRIHAAACCIAGSAALILGACAPVATVTPAHPTSALSSPNPSPTVGSENGNAAATQAALVAKVAAATGKSTAALNALLASAVVQPSILAAMRRPAESKPWSAYRPIFVNPTRIAEGIAFYHRHQALLQQVSAKYGVPAQYIVAIIGVETNYGANTGGYRVLDALATLAFHYPPRAAFFQSELVALLELPANKLPGPIPDIYGSYAGAEGLVQFMPSSIRDFAVDADGDGHINLNASLPDAFASVANYFKQHGWQTGQPVAVAAACSATAAVPPAYQNVAPTTSQQTFSSEGYTSATAVDPALPANLLTLAGADGPKYWLTFQNFYVITRYNHSPMYALAVTQLAAAIARGAATVPRAP